jgi:hypothetical protein
VQELAAVGMARLSLSCHAVWDDAFGIASIGAASHFLKIDMKKISFDEKKIKIIKINFWENSRKSVKTHAKLQKIITQEKIGISEI